MARDAGLSAMLFGSLAFAVFGTVRTFRREIESGTVAVALSHPVSRRVFFLAKFAGCSLATLGFAAIVGAAAATSVTGAAIGGAIAEANGDIAKIWGPSYAIGVATVFVPYPAGAALNRFAGFRFQPTAFAVVALLAFGGMCYRFDAALVSRLLPAAALVAAPAVAFAAFAAAAATRLRDSQALTATGLLLLAFVPAIGNYWLSDALSGGGKIPLAYASGALAAVAAPAAAFLFAGIRLFDGLDLP